MADTTTLQTPQPKTEVKRNQVLGLFEDTLELLVGGRGALVNEGPVRGEDLEKISGWEVIRPKILGERSDFHTSRKREDIYPGLKIQLEQELYQEHLKTIMRLPVEEKRIKINELNELQSHYRGSVDSGGNVTAYHEANAARKQAENLAMQIQNERAQKLIQESTRKTASKGSLLMNVDAQEGQSAVSSSGAIYTAG